MLNLGHARLRPMVMLMMLIVTLGGCQPAPREPDLGVIYNEAAQKIGADRNPVIVLPGILGSKLESPGTGQPIWGSFVYGAADADTAEGARLVALPMREGVPLSELRDEVEATEVLDTLTVDIALIRGVQFGAYIDILKTLAAGKYRDSTLQYDGTVDYADAHFTCFQFPYDWRRDCSEHAASLHALVLNAIERQPEGGRDKVDIIAHSMGGLVLRYYLMYGPAPLPEDGSLPPLTWAGAQHVETAVLIGTPNAGSVLSLEQLVKGVNFVALITPTYRASVLGSMPAIYQLLPRTRHGRVVYEDTGEAVDLYDVGTWEALGWGLLDPDEEATLEQLLPEVDSSSARRAIARDHLGKILSRTDQFFRSIDRDAELPAGTELFLVLGDAHATADKVAVDRATGALRVLENLPGDGTVSRTSALMDERVGSGYVPRLRTPIDWTGVLFLASDHLGLTRDSTFVDFMLYTLLERPRPRSPRDGLDKRQWTGLENLIREN